MIELLQTHETALNEEKKEVSVKSFFLNTTKQKEQREGKIAHP